MTTTTPVGWVPAQWPAWDIDRFPADLARFVVPEVVRRLRPLPERSAEGARARLVAVWSALRSTPIGYAFEPDRSGVDGRSPGQAIRAPGEVLVAPGSGTCLDLALVLAAGCVNAGLSAMVIVLD